MCHIKQDTRKRQPLNVQRGQIAKTARKGLSQDYYKKTTPVKELMTGNLTKSLKRDILKDISYKIKKAATLHEKDC